MRREDCSKIASVVRLFYPKSKTHTQKRLAINVAQAAHLNYIPLHEF